MSEGGRIKGALNVKKFEDFIGLRDRLNDWDKYMNSSMKKLSRPKISQECGFSKSVFSQNPLLIKMVNQLESELVRKGILQGGNNEIKVFEYDTQVDFISSYNQKVLSFKVQVNELTQKIAFYQSELEKLR